MKKYKVCRLIGKKVISPFQEFSYGKESELFGKILTFDFDDSDEKCSEGFYATDADGIIYSLNREKDCNVYEVEVSGEEKKFDEYKQRYSEATFIRRLSDAEVKEIIREQSEKMDWNYYEACYPVNPLLIDVPFDKEKAVKLLKQWSSVRSSVGDSVWSSVWDSVRDSVRSSVRSSVRDSVRSSVRSSVGDSVWSSVRSSVGSSVWDSVRDSVRSSVRDSVRFSVRDSVRFSIRDSVVAYISSFFPNIKEWKGINHEEGVNPFQSGVDLWMIGVTPSFDGKTWRLHKGKKAEVVFEITQKEFEPIEEENA